ncbi:hypothetical protein J6590_083459 [Homalodisca vitripennis]|nr:hypothetical protein J6590_083459 [Homalodisca vitripennis]
MVLNIDRRVEILNAFPQTRLSLDEDSNQRVVKDEDGCLCPIHIFENSIQSIEMTTEDKRNNTSRTLQDHNSRLLTSISARFESCNCCRPVIIRTLSLGLTQLPIQDNAPF